MKKVTVVIPTRNRAHLLTRSISSIFTQNYSNIEIIVSNNASTDSTEKMLEELSLQYQSLIVINHPNLLELSCHWDFVIRQWTTGDYVLLIPDDDILIDSSYIQKAVDTFEEYSTIGLVFANYYIVDEKFNRINSIEAKFSSFVDKKYLFENYNKELFGIMGVGIPHLTTLFSRKVYLEVGGFDFNCMCPDTYLWLKILLKYDAAFIQDKVAEYLVHTGNLSTTGQIEQIYSDTLIAPNVLRYAQSINLNSDVVINTLERMNKIFYNRFHLALFKNIKKNFINFQYISKINYKYLLEKVFTKLLF